MTEPTCSSSQDEDLKFYQENSHIYNCYAFALRAKSGIDGHPGSASGQYLRTLNPKDIDDSLRSDGLIPAVSTCNTDDDLPPAIEGYYIVAAVAAGTNTTGRRDCHFYRQMPDGSWWHKPGKLPPTNIDADGLVITNPRRSCRDYTKGTIAGNPSRTTGYDYYQINYNTFVGFYYVPVDGLEVAIGDLPDNIKESPSMKREKDCNRMLYGTSALHR